MHLLDDMVLFLNVETRKLRLDYGAVYLPPESEAYRAQCWTRR